MPHPTPQSTPHHAAGGQSTDDEKVRAEKERLERAEELERMVRKIFMPHEATRAVHDAVATSISTSLGNLLLRADPPDVIVRQLVRVTFENARGALGIAPEEDAFVIQGDKKIKQLCDKMDNDIRLAALNSLNIQLVNRLKDAKNEREKAYLEKIISYLKAHKGGATVFDEEALTDKIHHAIESIGAALRKRLGMNNPLDE